MEKPGLNFKATIDDNYFNRKLDGMKKGVNGLNEALNKNLSNQTSLINKNNNAFAEQRKLLNELKQSLSKATDKTEIARYEKSIVDATNALRKLNEEAKKTPKTAPLVGGGSGGALPNPAIIGATETATDKATRSFGGLFKTIASSFGIMSAFYAVIGLLRGAFNTIVEFDSKLLNVSKTTGLAGQELKDLGVSLRVLSQELEVVSVSKLTEYASVAGQLGVKGSADILAFSKALAQLEVTSNISGAEGGSQIARLLTLVDGGVTNVKAFGDEITRLGNNFPATEAEILKNSLAVAQNTGVYKLARQEVLAYGTATKSIGVEAELTGASIGRSLQVIEEVLRSGKNIENFSKITGRSVEDLKASFKTDPSGVLYSFIKGLNEINKSGGSVVKTLNDIGINGNRDEKVLGSLASKGFDVLTRALEDVGSASGAMQQEFETASGKIENSIEGVKVSWENLVLAINGSDNAIGNFVNAFLSATSTVITAISRMSTSWKELWGIAGSEGQKQGRESALLNYMDFDKFENQRNRALKDRQELFKKEKKLTDDIEAETKRYNEALANKSIFDFTGAAGRKEGKNLEELNKQLNNVKEQRKVIEELFESYKNPAVTTTTKTPEELESEAERKKRENEAKRAAKQTESQYKKQVQFIDEVAKVERELNQSVLTGREEAMSKISNKYDDLIKKARELKVTESEINRINELRAKETAITNYRADTTALVTSLEQQKKDYEDFESFKKKVGIEEATKMYAGIIDVSKNYQQVLQDELNAYSNRENSLIPLTDVEKERVNELFKLLQEYGIEQSEKEKKAIETLVVTTMSVTDKLKVLYENYQKDLTDLQSKYSGDRLKKEEDNLYQVFANESENLKSGIIGYTDEFQKALDIIGASTRRQAQSQIDSLNIILSGSNKLTKAQVLAIKSTIKDLNKALLTSDNNGGSGALNQLSTQINLIEAEIKSYEDKIKNASREDSETVEQFTARVKLMEDALGLLQQKSENLRWDKLVQTGIELGGISNSLEILSNSSDFFDENIKSAFKTFSVMLKLVSNISNIIKDIGGGLKEAGASSGNGWLAIVGAVLEIMTSIVELSKEQEKASEQAKKDVVDYYAGLISGEAEYQSLLRQRALANIQNDETLTPYDALKNQMSELKRQQGEVAKTYQDLFERIAQNGVYVTSKERDKGEVDTTYARFADALIGGSDSFQTLGDIVSSYENLEKLFAEGRLEGSTLDLFLELRKSKEEMDALGLSVKDVQKAINEMVTGTSWSEMSKKIADMFASGTNSAIEFANTMEKIIRNAILSGFQARFIDEAMKDLFDMLANFSNDEDGLTQDEIDQFNMNAERVFEQLNADWERITSGLNLDFGQDDLGGSAKDGIKRITETQADRLTGILTGMQVDVIESRKSLQISNNLLSSSLDNLIGIEFNTRRTYESVERIENILQNNQQQALGL